MDHDSDNQNIYDLMIEIGKVRKTYHQGAKDKSYRYDEIWRLAPRRELMLSRSVKDIRRGQTISFDYDSGRVTARVISTKASSVKGIILCGSERGTIKDFETFELLNVVELFASSLLYDLHEAQYLEVGEDKKVQNQTTP